QAIRLTALGTYALGLTDIYRPTNSDPTDTQPLKVLPNLEIVTLGDIPAADRLVLSAYATQTADRVWGCVSHHPARSDRHRPRPERVHHLPHPTHRTQTA
ncbi:MAG: hypothetical protein ACRDRV_19960, partial [Pseudonocardiaceae bacterium]